MTSLNDLVFEWGVANGYATYGEAKAALTDGLTQDQVADSVVPSNWNEGLYGLADIPAVLREAVLWLDADYSEVNEPRAINQGTGGTALDAKYGSVLGAYVYDGAAVLPGIASNSLSVPDGAALDVTSGIEIVTLVRLFQWDNGANTSLLSKRNTGQWAYSLSINSAGVFTLVLTSDGSTPQIANFGTTASLVDGDAYWLKANWRSSDGLCRMWTAPYDGSSAEPSSGWTRNGLDQNILVGGTIHNSTDPLYIGSRGGTLEVQAMDVYRAIVRNGIDGTTVLDVNLMSVADYATSFTATTGQTVTVNSTSADTNDPLLLPHTGENYVHLPSVAGNYLSIPSGAPFSLPGDYEVVLRTSGKDFGTADYKHLISKMLGPDFELAFYSYGNGVLTVIPGVASARVDTSVKFTPGDVVVWLKAEVTLDDGFGHCNVKYYWAADQPNEPITWTLIESATNPSEAGVPVTTAVPILIHNETGGNVPASGPFRRAIVRNGIGGTTVLDVNCTTDITDAGATSFTATSGQTVTVIRSTSGRKTALVTRPVWLFGTDDYLEVADNALLDFDIDEPFTMVAVFRLWGTQTNGRIMAKSASGEPGYGLQASAATDVQVTVYDSAFPSITRTFVLGELTTLMGGVKNNTHIFGVLNAGAESLQANTTTLPISNTGTLRIGAQFNGVFADMEFFGAALFRRALDADEIAAINNYYGTA